MIKATLKRQGEHFYLYDAASHAAFDERVFDREWLIGQGYCDRLIDNGRGQVTLFTYQGTSLVYRHYLRGGMASKISHDRYFWKGLRATRAYREWRILRKLHAEGFPVPKPWAARVSKLPLTCSQDLIMHCLPNEGTLADHLGTSQLPTHLWMQIGATISRFHERGVYHADLNANNILLNQLQDVFIIDFDRAEIRDSGSWKQANISRLRRSLDKLQGLNDVFFFTEEDWQAFEEGYGSSTQLEAVNP